MVFTQARGLPRLDFYVYLFHSTHTLNLWLPQNTEQNSRKRKMYEELSMCLLHRARRLSQKRPAVVVASQPHSKEGQVDYYVWSDPDICAVLAADFVRGGCRHDQRLKIHSIKSVLWEKLDDQQHIINHANHQQQRPCE